MIVADADLFIESVGSDESTEKDGEDEETVDASVNADDDVIGIEDDDGTETSSVELTFGEMTSPTEVDDEVKTSEDEKSAESFEMEDAVSDERSLPNDSSSG